MKTKILKAFASFALVLMVLSIVPSGAFAAEDAAVVKDAGPVRNGKIIGNMTAINMDETVIRVGGIHGMQMMPKNPQQLEQYLILIEGLDDNNFEEIQANILEMLGNQIERLNEMKTHCLEKENEEMSEELEGRAAELEEFYEEIEGANSAEELEMVIFTSIKENLLESLENKIEKLEEIKAGLNQSENADKIANLDEEISKLQTLYEAVSNAENLDDFKEIKFSFAKEKILNMLDRQIIMLEEKLENFDETEFRFLSAEDLEVRLSELENLKEIVNNAESQEDLKEIKDYFSFGIKGFQINSGSFYNGIRINFNDLGPMEGKGPRNILELQE